MVVFECVACGAALTVPLSQVDRPDHEHHAWANSTEFTPSLLPPGTYAAQGDFLVGPGDVRGLFWVDEHPEGWCCGVNGSDPNLACACGQPVATRVDDCSWWQVVRFEPGAVRATGEPDPVRPWEAFGWDSVPLTEGELWWPRRVGIAAGAALAGVLLAARNAPVLAAEGPVHDLFQSHLDAWRPPGPPPRTLALAGPGLRAQADLLMVPRHPQTGEPWPVPGTRVPISAELWLWLANDKPPYLPRTGGQWERYFRHDPLPCRPGELWLDDNVTRRVMSNPRN
ncbi:hypothetical protein [Lentzea sp. NEAU-D7]|uniref:hypothetical protein n=1 Tax=Lentzea sp. NEAU-D7 TaxID=2994667 RepID=UPI00224A588E|nr:hypothetical protein [Lentzea sp. NEAU-D7]MCX2951198.1 hypothetical protein [Lentzea sp. NEAU-D7]